MNMSNKTKKNSINLNELISFNFYSGWREIEQLFRHIVGTDMTLQKSFILSFLHDSYRTMTEVSEHLNLDPSAVSTIVDRMFKKGLIHRVRDPRDRRVMLVSLTDEGILLKLKLDEKVKVFSNVLDEGISSEDKLVLRRIISQIQANRIRNSAIEVE